MIYGIRLLEILKVLQMKTHLAMSRTAEAKTPAEACHLISDIDASISSGCFKTLGMAVAPCSVRTIGRRRGFGGAY